MNMPSLESEKNSANKSSFNRGPLLSGFAILLAVIALALTLMQSTWLRKKQQVVKTVSIAQFQTLGQKMVKMQAQLAQLQTPQHLQREQQALLMSINQLQLLKVYNTYFYQPQFLLASLQSVQKQLSFFNDIKFSAAQKLLQAKIVSLQNNKQPASTVLLSQLSKLQQQIANVEKTKTSSPLKQQQKQASQTNTQTGWHAAWDKTLQTLKSMVVVRHHLAEQNPLLALDEHAQQNLDWQILLQQAKIAVLAHDQTLYQQNLQSLQQQLHHMPKQKAQMRAALLAQLKTLLAVNVAEKKVHLDEIIQALQQIKFL